MFRKQRQDELRMFLSKKHGNKDVEVKLEDWRLDSVEKIDSKLKEYQQVYYYRQPEALKSKSESIVGIKSSIYTAMKSIDQVEGCDNFNQDINILIRENNEFIAKKHSINSKELFKIIDPQLRKMFIIKFLLQIQNEQLQHFTTKTLSRLYTSEDQLITPKSHLALFNWIRLKAKLKTLDSQLKYNLAQLILKEPNKSFLANQIHNKTEILQLIDRPHPDITNILNELNSLLNKYVAAKQEQIKSSIKWDIEKEKLFNDKKRHIKSKFGWLIDSSDFNTVTFGDQIHSENGQNQNKLQRQMLLNQYREGGLLSQDQYEFISNTSSLINKKLNKEMIQQIVDQLDKTIIEDIELQMSEEVLKLFKSQENNLQKARLKWLNDINRQKKSCSAIKEQERQEKLLEEKEIEENANYIKKITHIIRYIEKHHKEKELLDHKKQVNLIARIHNTPYANKYVLLFKDKMMEIVKAYRQKISNQYKPIHLRQSLDSHILFKDNQSALTLGQVKYKFHPPSKLILTNQYSEKLAYYRKKLETDSIAQDLRDYERTLLTDKMNKLKLRGEENKFRHQIKDGKVDKEAMIKYYSGGVRLNDKNELGPLDNDDHDWIDINIKIQAINKIKKAIKKYILRKEIKEMTSQLMHQKQLKARSQLNNLLKQTVIKHNPKLLEYQKSKTIQSFQSPKNLLSQSTTFKPIHNTKGFKLKINKLFTAAKKSNLDMLKISSYTFSSEEVNSIDKNLSTPLYYAVSNNDLTFVIYLITLGADPNIQCIKGDTPLHIALKNNNEQITSYLIQAGASLDIINNLGQTPIAYGQIELLKHLNLAKAIPIVDNPKLKTFNDKILSPFKPLPEKPNTAEMKFLRLQSASSSVRIQFEGRSRLQQYQ